MKNPLTQKEQQVIDNIILKIEISMKLNNCNLGALSQIMSFEYQALYKFMKNKNYVPSMSSLVSISNYLQCSLAELLSDFIYFKIPLLNDFKNIEDLQSNKGFQDVRIQIISTKYLDYQNNKMFCIKSSNTKYQHGDIYVLTNSINLDGKYLLEIDNYIETIDVISTSSKFIIVEKNGEEERILTTKFTPIAKLIAHSIIYKDYENIITLTDY